jgi:hypothetical protein
MDVDIELAYTEGRSGRYAIISDFDLEQSRTRRWDTSHGTPRKYIYGQGLINGGEHLIEIRTTNGDVVLREGR